MPRNTFQYVLVSHRFTPFWQPMGNAHEPGPVLPLIVAFSRYDDALAWGRAECEKQWGGLGLVSPRFDFSETNYYAASMGAELQIEIWTADRLVSPTELVDLKLQTNDWEAAYAKLGKHPEARPLNLDPGYVGLGKFVLASTKDHSHRLYLGRGIFGEVTLGFRQGEWISRDWTYPNYRRADYHQFLSRCRQRLVERLREEPSA